MDWLDRLSIWAIVVLIIGSFALITGHMGEARPERNLQQRTATAEDGASNSDIAAKVKLVKNFIEAGNLDKAETLAHVLIQKYPYEGELRMVMGDIYMRKQEAVKGMREYKEAVDLNPDYLDKKTPLFQGKKLKIAVREALAQIDERIKLNPDDESAKRERKAIYYLQRRIAGSCS